MGILSSKRFNEILVESSFKNYESFIETGTYNGRSIIPLAKEFIKKDFHTIEIVNDLYLFAKKKAEKENLQNIQFYLGNSIDLIAKILSNITNNNIVIFLDAHSSSYEGYSAESIEQDSDENFFRKMINKIRGKKKNISTDIKINKLSTIEVPLIKELEIISKFNKNFLIIIDDYDLFGKKFNFADWSKINQSIIENLFKENIEKIYTKSKQGLNSPQLIIQTKIK